VIAYDLLTRRERWRAWPEEASVAFSLVADNGLVYVPFVSGQVIALDARDGRERWRLGGPAEGFRWAPVIAGPRLFLSGAAAGIVALRRGGGE
jgi:outer membrane protein assembly factor BamB